MYGSSWKDMSDAEREELREAFDERRRVEEGKNKNKYPQLWALFQEIAPDRNKDVVEHAFDVVISLYHEEHRGHHNVDHLLDLAVHFEHHQDKFAEDRRAVIAALIYHDGMYDCRPGEDEEQSALLMREELESLGVEESVIDRAEQLVRWAATHDALEDDHVAQLFLDMDMSILGARFDAYDAYLNGVAKEFCTMHNISRDQFDQARLSIFVEPTLNKGAIFKTREYQPYEAIALQNLQREKSAVLAKLSSAPQAKP